MGSGIAAHGRPVTETLLSGVRFRVAVKRFTSEAVFVVWHGG
jgi:hypothetical protein